MNRRLQLINWVRAQHEGQSVKYTNSPYFEHVLAVANQAAEAGVLTYEIGICHDLLEKTKVTQAELFDRVKDFGYTATEAEHIASCVAELTRHFTGTENPLPKKMRKALEEERLLTISADAQTVKYADWHYNANWMMAHDRHHAGGYLKRHIQLTEEMTLGDDGLRAIILTHFNTLLRELDEE